MSKLPIWQRPIAWVIVLMLLPFVAAWCAYRRARWIIWAGKMWRPGGPYHG